MFSNHLGRWRAAAAASLLGLAAAAMIHPTPAHAAGLLIQPNDIAVATFGNLIDRPLDKIDPGTGNRSRIADGLPDRATQVTSDREGNLFVAMFDRGIIRIDRFTGARKTIVSPSQGLVPRDLVFTPDNKLVVAADVFTGPALFALDPSTGKSETIAQNSLFGNFVSGIALESTGKIVVADAINNQIVRVDPLTHQGTRLATFAAGNTLGSLIVADDGNILVRTKLSDSAHTPALVKVDPQTGLKTILIKGHPHFDRNSGMARGDDGRIYLSERGFGNSRSEILVMSAPFTSVKLLNTAGESDSLDLTLVANGQQPPIPNPVANPDRFIVEQPIGQFVNSTSLLANDRNFAGTPIVAERVTDVQHGFTSFFSDGFFFYFPATGFVGDDTLTYRVRAGNRVSPPATVTFHVLPPQAPIAKNDFLATAFNKPIAFEPANGPLFNDTDPQGDKLSGAKIVTGATHGTASFDADSTMRYTPDIGFSGEDTFTYTVTDGKHTSAPATVSMLVGNPPPANRAPRIAITKGGTINVAGTSATANVTISDPETGANGLALTATSSNTALVPASALTLGGTANGRTVTVTPKPGVTGTATLTLTVKDGGGLTKTATLTVLVDDNGDHTLTGTGGSDLLFGLGGKDILSGGGGIDLIAGGDGDDTMTGGPEADLFRGGAGTNKVTDLNPAEGDFSS